MKRHEPHGKHRMSGTALAIATPYIGAAVVLAGVLVSGYDERPAAAPVASPQAHAAPLQAAPVTAVLQVSVEDATAHSDAALLEPDESINSIGLLAP